MKSPARPHGVSSRSGPGPLVSIITPTLNSEMFLRETIDSVAGQTYGNIEHIIVDGGSSDGTLAILKRYPRLTVLHGRDKGMYDAVNKGLRASSGGILAYLNSDDLYTPSSVERVVNFFASNPGTDLVFSDLLYIDERGETLFTRKYPPFNWTLFSVLDGSTVPQQTCFWCRTVHDAAGFFDDSFRMAGDFEFIMRVGKTRTIAKIAGSPLARFRFHPAMQTLTRKTLNDAEIERIHDLHKAVPAWAAGPARLLAMARYRLRNVHRLKDKLKTRLSGERPIYRP